MYKYTESLCQRKDAYFYTKVTGKPRPAAGGVFSGAKEKLFTSYLPEKRGL